MHKHILSAVLSISASVSFADPRIASDFSDIAFYDAIEEAVAASDPSSRYTEEKLQAHLELHKNYQTLKNELGENFGGAWLSEDENGKPFIVISSTGSLTKKTTLLENTINGLTTDKLVINVKNSYDYLESMQEKLLKLLTKANQRDYFKEGLTDSGVKLIYSFYVDEREGAFFVRGKKKNKHAIFMYLASEQFDVNDIRFEEQEEPVNFFPNSYDVNP